MSPGDRSFLLKRAVLRALEDCGEFPIGETALREAAALKVDHLRPTVAELAASFFAVEQAQLAVALTTERGRKYRLTDSGRLWLAEHAA